MASTNKETLRWHRATERNRKIIAEAKDVPCADCSGRFPAVCMDFNHLGRKHKNIAHMMTASLDRLLAEIAKCDVICANCHRIRTQQAEHFGSQHLKPRVIVRGSVGTTPIGT